MRIRLADFNSDEKGVWEVFSNVIKTGDTYVFSPDTERSKLKDLWFSKAKKTYVAEEGGKIIGTYILKPNQIDLGSHIANAGYMVHPDAQGKGIGKALCEHSLKVAKEAGFYGMQFNLVVSTNTGAVKLWKKFGFRIVGTIPEAFKHSSKGFVDAHIMYKKL